MPGRVTLGLYNTYDAGRWHDVMRVSLARAAPVCAAFDCNLVTFGFPYEDGRRRTGRRLEEGVELASPAQIAQFVTESSSIGEGADYLAELVRKARFLVQPFPRLGSDVGWPPQLGSAVATTPHPDPAKATTPRRVAHALGGGQSHLLVLGLGPRGLPDAVLAGTRTHLEVTGRGVSLETATALGAIPALIKAHLEHEVGP
ncbi:MAG: DUF531 family protein [Thermoplasmatota archaeon]